MKFWVVSLALTLQLLLGGVAYAQTVIYEDDFEGGVSGWSSNTTTDASMIGTRILGRFGGGNDVTRTFTVPAGTTALTIEFDMLRIDSWDFFRSGDREDGFSVLIGGVPIFSEIPFFQSTPLPRLGFNAGQGPRSGTTGNVDWAHVPVAPTAAQLAAGINQIDLGFSNRGTFDSDQIHRFTITVNNPGATVDLTLRADLNQDISDESVAYDNFLVTVPGPPITEISAVAETFSPIDGASGGVTSSVLASDTYDDQPATLSDVTLSVLSSTSSNVVLDPLTGLITVAPGTPAGSYDVEYEICEISAPTNCSSITEMVTVNDPSTGGGGGGVCPAGAVLVPGPHYVADTEFVGFNRPQNLSNAIGEPEAFPVDNLGQTGTSFSQPFIYDLTGDPDVFVPGGEAIDLSFASHFGSEPTVTISSSLDNVNYTPFGTSTGPWDNNIFRFDRYTVPSGGIRYLQFSVSGNLRFDGVIYSTQCQSGSTSVVVAAADDSETVTSLATAQPNVLNVIDNDDFDGNTPSSFDLALSADSTLPPELTFDTTTGAVGLAADAPAGVYSFDYDICEQGTTNCATATVEITVLSGDTDLVTVKTLSSASATPNEGDTVTFEIEVTNNGPADATGVSLTDLLPTGLTATAANGTVSAGSYDADTGLWTLDPLANDASATLTIEGTVDAGQGGNAITNTLSSPASGDQTDPSTNGDDLTETVNVMTPSPSLTMTKVADSQGPHKVGDVVTYTYTVTNDGDVNINDVTVADTHNGIGSLSAISVGTLTNTSGNSLDDGADGVVDVLAPGDSASFTSTYVVLLPDLLAGGTISNDATATGTPVSGTLMDATASETVNLSTLPPADVLTRPTSCGAYNHAGWSVPGGPFANANIVFGSGDVQRDPYLYAGLSRDAAGRITTYYGPPDHTDSAASGNPARLNLEDQNTTVLPHVSEYHQTVYRLEGAPGTTETVTFQSTGGSDNLTAWIENDSGVVIASSTSDTNSDDGWIFGTNNSTTLNFTYPADGTVYLYGGLFDPTANYGPTQIFDYTCPAPSLSITKVADNQGPHKVDDIVTYTYTVTNDGDVNINDVTVADTHNGSDPAPTPGNETLLTDAGTQGDSTDATVDGTWDVLAPGDIVTFTGTYTITQTDVDNL